MLFKNFKTFSELDCVADFTESTQKFCLLVDELSAKFHKSIILSELEDEIQEDPVSTIKQAMINMLLVTFRLQICSLKSNDKHETMVEEFKYNLQRLKEAMGVLELVDMLPIDLMP